MEPMQVMKAGIGLGVPELLVVLVLVLIVFGAGKLPTVGGSLGEAIRNFKKGMDGKGDEKKKGESDALKTLNPNSDKGEK